MVLLLHAELQDDQQAHSDSAEDFTVAWVKVGGGANIAAVTRRAAATNHAGRAYVSPQNSNSAAVDCLAGTSEDTGLIRF